jgi:hypothetical protein
VVALLAFAASAPARPHDVLFIAVDDLRPNIAAFGPKFMHTPHLDKLASEGVLFERAYVQYSYCAPSRNRCAPCQCFSDTCSPEAHCRVRSAKSVCVAPSCS